MKCIFPIKILVLSSGGVSTQDTIYIQNPSFEGKPAMSRVPDKWIDLGTEQFPGQTPPDMQPIREWANHRNPVMADHM